MSLGKHFPHVNVERQKIIHPVKGTDDQTCMHTLSHKLLSHD